jgi:hypothetical protein
LRAPSCTSHAPSPSHNPHNIIHSGACSFLSSLLFVHLQTFALLCSSVPRLNTLGVCVSIVARRQQQQNIDTRTRHIYCTMHAASLTLAPARLSLLHNAYTCPTHVLNTIGAHRQHKQTYKQRLL